MSAVDVAVFEAAKKQQQQKTWHYQIERHQMENDGVKRFVSTLIVITESAVAKCQHI